MSLQKKINKLQRDPKLFFKDMFLKKYIPIKNKAKTITPKKNNGYSKYVIVSAVYNVEKYLNDYFNSIINQRLDFKNNIHIICVDDGSSDNSAKIIKHYQKKYPKNITYIYKENGGQASARNLGLKLLQEDPNLKDKFTWVTFTDPDDFLDRDYFYEVDEFLAKNRDKSIAVMHAKQVLFFEKFNSYQDHPLSHYKHKDKVSIKKINDLTLESQSSTRSVFSLSLMDYQNRFKEGVNYFEDMAFTLKFYTKCNDNDLAVFLSSSIYYIRKREDGNSTMNQSHKSRVFYIDALELCLETLKESKNKSKGLFLHTQYSVFSMIIYQIRSLVDNQQKLSFLSDLDKKRYIELLEEIFDLTDPKVIETFNAAGNNYFYKFGILNCFKDTKLPFNIAYIKDYDFAKEQILIQYYSDVEDEVESIRFDGIEVYADYEKVIRHDFLNKSFCYEKLLWIHVPKESKNLNMFIDGKKAMIGFKIYDIKVQDIRKEFANSSFLDNTWLFIDRDIEADDNAERLYRYVAKNYPDQKIVFALMKDCPDWSRLEKDGFNLVECYSSEFYQIAKKCKFFISSHTPQGYQVKLNNSQKFVFLGHGVDAVDISDYFNRLSNIKLRTSTTYGEFKSLVDSDLRYKLTKKEVALTGQARHDALLAGNKTNNKNIMIMPTWRNYLVLPREKTFDRKIADNFLESEYFIKWLSLLNSNTLEKLANDYNYTITFVPHFNMRDILNYLNIPNYIKIGYREDGESFQKYFQESDLMITDYTSAAFEMGYLKKPVIYYQFDEEEFFNSHTYTKGYFDYKRDGFGPVVITQEELLTELEILIKNNCQVGESYRSNIENTFAFRDGKCCERIYQAIVELDKPYESKIIIEQIRQKAKDALKYECFYEASCRYRYILENSENIDTNDVEQYLYCALQSNNGYEASKFLLSIQDKTQFNTHIKVELIKGILSKNSNSKEEIEWILNALENIQVGSDELLSLTWAKLRIYIYLEKREKIKETINILKNEFNISKDEIDLELYLLRNNILAASTSGGAGDKVLHLMNCYLREMVSSCEVFGI